MTSLKTVKPPHNLFIFDDLIKEYNDIKQKYIINWQINQKLTKNINKYLLNPSSIDVSMITIESVQKLQNNALFLQKSLSNINPIQIKHDQ